MVCNTVNLLFFVGYLQCTFKFGGFSAYNIHIDKIKALNKMYIISLSTFCIKTYANFYLSGN